jgi:hypothetical protein
MRDASLSMLLAPRWHSGGGGLQNLIMQSTFSILLCLTTLDMLVTFYQKYNLHMEPRQEEREKGMTGKRSMAVVEGPGG